MPKKARNHNAATNSVLTINIYHENDAIQCYKPKIFKNNNFKISNTFTNTSLTSLWFKSLPWHHVVKVSSSLICLAPAAILAIMLPRAGK